MKRFTTTQTAEVLNVSPEMVRIYRQLGYLVGTTASGKNGQGQRFYFEEGEVLAFKRGGAIAAKAYRESHGNPVPPRARGRCRKKAT